MYQENAYVNPYVNSIAESLSAPARIRANALRQTGAIQANAQQQRGQIAGQTAQQIGQTIAAIPQQIQQQQVTNDEATLRAAQIATVKRQQAATQALGAAIKQYPGDNAAIAKALDEAGFPEQGASWLKTTTDNAENISKLATIKTSYAKHVRETVGDLAYGAKTPQEFISSIGILAATGEIDEPTALKMAEAASDPAAMEQIRNQYLQFSPRYLAEQKAIQDAKGRPVSPGQVVPILGDEPPAGPVAPDVPKPANSQEAEFRLDGKDVKGDYVPGVGGQPGKYFYNGQDVTGKVTKIPPASATPRPEGLTPNAALDATLKLRDRFVRETQAAQLVKTQYEQMKSSLDAVKKGSAAAGSQGVLVTFQKILDPTSVVRESEYARSSSGLSLLNRLEGQWMKIQQGGAGVSVGELETFVKLAEQWVKNSATAAKQTQEQINNIATEYGLKPENITRDMGASVVPPPQAANAPKLGEIVTVKGQKVRVTAIKPDGTYQGVPVK